jgi:hypothetical protein
MQRTSFSFLLIICLKELSVYRYRYRHRYQLQCSKCVVLTITETESDPGAEGSLLLWHCGGAAKNNQ